ncbi:MAG: carboxypeptidase regulatory-like domain-containing protein [Pyrinomonadaceae bacterium]
MRISARLKFRRLVLIACLASLAGLAPASGFLSNDGITAAAAVVRRGGTPTPIQPAMLTTGVLQQIVTFVDPANAPASQSFVPGLPTDTSPHGLTYAGNDLALIGDFERSRIFVVRASDSALLATMNTSAAGYNGSGTLAVPPQQNVALASGNSSNVKIIQAPFTATSTITSVALPGFVRNFQTQAIVFNSAGRAFIRHSTGISVLDPPYTSVVFTIPINTGLRAAIAITPDGNTLLATGSNGITTSVFIYNAPFSAASTAQIKSVFGGANGLKVTPDGTQAIVVSADLHAAAVIFAPFSASSTVQALPLPSGAEGFEDVDISDDGQIAILAGRSETEPPILIRAPFTAAGARSSNLPVNQPNPARGGGAVRFLPPRVIAPPATVSGLVTTPDGRGLRNAVVSLLNNSTGVKSTVLTSSFGAFTFNNVATGASYTISVNSRRYRFSAQQRTINGDLSDVNFVGLE